MAKEREHHCATCSTSTLHRGRKSLEKYPYPPFMLELRKAKPASMQAVKTVVIFAPTMPGSTQFHVCAILPHRSSPLWSGIGCVGHVCGLGPLPWAEQTMGPQALLTHLTLSTSYPSFDPQKLPRAAPSSAALLTKEGSGRKECVIPLCMYVSFPLTSLFLQYFIFFLSSRLLELRKK